MGLGALVCSWTEPYAAGGGAVPPAAVWTTDAACSYDGGLTGWGTGLAWGGDDGTGADGCGFGVLVSDAGLALPILGGGANDQGSTTGRLGGGGVVA